MPDAAAGAAVAAPVQKPECFVIMPISEPPGYAPGHFRRVYEDLFVPACDMAGFRARLASDVRETNLIHLDVLQRLLSAPMVLCDVSARNPNVLFELGLRQAFDKPVTMVREVGTTPIFDVDVLRYTDYRPGLVYRDVLEDQERVASSIRATREACERNDGANSLIRLMGLTDPARAPDTVASADSSVLRLLLSEMGEIKAALRSRPALSSAAMPPGFPRLPSGGVDVERVTDYIQAATPRALAIDNLRNEAVHRLATVPASAIQRFVDSLSAEELDLWRRFIGWPPGVNSPQSLAKIAGESSLEYGTLLIVVHELLVRFFREIVRDHDASGPVVGPHEQRP